MIDARIGVLITLVAAGCNAAKKDCEHARDVMATSWEQNAKEAIATVEPGQRGELERTAAKEVAHLRGVFVETCLAQPEATRACVARIDELLATDRERKAAFDRCGLDDEACRTAAKTAAETAVGECGKALDSLIAAASKGL